MPRCCTTSCCLDPTTSLRRAPGAARTNGRSLDQAQHTTSRPQDLDYDSPELDQTDVAVQDVQLSEQGRTARLQLPLVPGFVYRLSIDVPGADGASFLNQDAWYTLHAVPR